MSAKPSYAGNGAYPDSYYAASRNIDRAPTVLEGEIQADVAVLTHSVRPSFPRSRDFTRILFLAFVVGFMLSLGAALLLELLSPRVRSAEDIDLPVLGTLKKRKYQHKALPNTELLPQK